jgi:hypothetical protein
MHHSRKADYLRACLVLLPKRAGLEKVYEQMHMSLLDLLQITVEFQILEQELQNFPIIAVPPIPNFSTANNGITPEIRFRYYSF